MRSLNGFLAYTHLVMIDYLLLLTYAELLGLRRSYPLARLRKRNSYARIEVDLASEKPPTTREGEEARRWFMQQ